MMTSKEKPKKFREKTASGQFFNLKKAVFWMWRSVDIVLTDVSKERIAYIFRVEDKKKSASEPA
jgi:hypothetical protein